jgi:hypothetical protein
MELQRDTNEAIDALVHMRDMNMTKPVVIKLINGLRTAVVNDIHAELYQLYGRGPEDYNLTIDQVLQNRSVKKVLNDLINALSGTSGRTLVPKRPATRPSAPIGRGRNCPKCGLPK